jgi:uncharacterized membrane protein
LAWKPRNSKGGNVEVVVREAEVDDRDELIIRALAEAGEPLTLAEISKRSGLGRALVWRKLKKLVARGIVEKVVIDGRPHYRLARPPEDRGEHVS